MQSNRQDYYKQKIWCDAKDELGIWRVGRIRKRQINVITVHFDGWSDKWKQAYCIHSSLIAPFRMHSVGSTGQSSKPLRDWDFNEDSIKTSEGIMTILTHGNFTGLSPFELTLFLRGDLYMQVDCLMNHSYTNPAKEISRVVEFFSGIIDMIIKWIVVVQSEFKNCELDNPGKYLIKASDSICRAAFEVLDMLNSIFGFEQRTAGFYEKYKQYCNPKVFIQAFFNKEGIKHFINLIKVIGLENVWHIAVNIPAIFSLSTVAANDRYILSLTESIINQIECFTTENAGIITEKPELVMRFIKNMENMIDLVSSPHQKENYMDFFRNFFQMGKVPWNREIEIDSAEPGRISLMSPRNKVSAFPTPRRGTLKISPAKKFDFPDSSPDTIETLKELIEKRHSECVKLIETRLSERREIEERLELGFQKHQSCDQQEFSILSTIEFLLSENKFDEALKVIRWRKKILKVSAMNGWDVAQETANRTWNKLDVDPVDIMEANLKIIDASNRYLGET